MKNTEINEKLNSLRSVLDEANNILKDLYDSDMFIIVSYLENGKIEAPKLEIKTAIQHINYLKD